MQLETTMKWQKTAGANGIEMVGSHKQQENELLSGACQTSIVIRLIDVLCEKKSIC